MPVMFLGSTFDIFNTSAYVLGLAGRQHWNHPSGLRRHHWNHPSGLGRHHWNHPSGLGRHHWNHPSGLGRHHWNYLCNKMKHKVYYEPPIAMDN